MCVQANSIFFLLAVPTFNYTSMVPTPVLSPIFFHSSLDILSGQWIFTIFVGVCW